MKNLFRYLFMSLLVWITFEVVIPEAYCQDGMAAAKNMKVNQIQNKIELRIYKYKYDEFASREDLVLEELDESEDLGSTIPLLSSECWELVETIEKKDGQPLYNLTLGNQYLVEAIHIDEITHVIPTLSINLVTKPKYPVCEFDTHFKSMGKYGVDHRRAWLITLPKESKRKTGKFSLEDMEFPLKKFPEFYISF